MSELTNIGQRRNRRRTWGQRESIDLGLEVMALTLVPGQKLELREIAAFCDCSHQAISHIEKQALLKMRMEAERRGLELDIELMLS